MKKFICHHLGVEHVENYFVCLGCKKPFNSIEEWKADAKLRREADELPKKPVGRPPRRYTCNDCWKTMGSAAVRVHKCASADLKREEQV